MSGEGMHAALHAVARGRLWVPFWVRLVGVKWGGVFVQTAGSRDSCMLAA